MRSRVSLRFRGAIFLFFFFNKCLLVSLGQGLWTTELLAAWNARDDMHKFQLVCIVHNVRDVGWQEIIPEWSRRNAFRLVVISQQFVFFPLGFFILTLSYPLSSVANAFRHSFLVHSTSANPVLSSAGYEHIPIDVFVPIFDVPNLPHLSLSRQLSNAVISGSYESNRRDYAHVIEELFECLRGKHPLLYQPHLNSFYS